MTSGSRKLVLVDAYSLLYRAFFGGRYLSTSDNQPTGAVFGFTNMLFSLLNSEKPDAIVVCWDAPHRTLRREQFHTYKAHRPEPDPTLRAQMPLAREVVQAFGIQSAEAPGYEADDLIGTLAARGARDGYQVVILTGDTDELQLVGDGVTVQMTQRGVSEVKVFDYDAVRKRYGIEPNRIPDWKAIVGDTSDNIAGVAGIGEKGATALLQQWGNLESVLDHVEQIANPKHRDALRQAAAQARDSKHLATIICDAPVDLEIRPYAPTEEDWQRVRALFTELEFRSLLARIPQPVGAPLAAKEAAAPGPAFEARPEQIQSEEALIAAIERARRAGVIAVQVETDGGLPMNAELRGLAFASGPDIGEYVALRRGSAAAGAVEGLFASDETEKAIDRGFEAALREVAPLVEDSEADYAGYNAKLAEIMLEQGGLHPRPVTFDVLLAAYLLNAGRTSYPLMDIAEVYLGVRLEADDAFAPHESLARDAAAILALVEPLKERLRADGMMEVFEQVEMPLVPVLARMEQAGVLVDMPYLSTLSARMAGELDKLATDIYELAGVQFDIGSVKQLQSILFDKLQLPTGKRTKTGYSTGADLLEQLAPRYEICRKILDWREVSKLKSTYADALVRLVNPRTGRIHTQLNQARTSTGRLSSSDPNLQNVPIRSEVGREIRRTFIAPPGRVLLSCDYSQIELRVLAHVTKDPTLVGAFQADHDIHAVTAAAVFGVPVEEVTADQRRHAKTINFAVIYGQSAFSTAAMLGVETGVASTWIRDYFARLPGVQRYVVETTALAHRQKYVSTLMGRRRYVPEIDSGNAQIRQSAERAAVNMPIQGAAADIMKLAMIAVFRYLQDECAGGCTLLLQVHDELLFEVDRDALATVAPEVVHRMESAYPLAVRLRVDAKVGENWAEMTALR